MVSIALEIIIPVLPSEDKLPALLAVISSSKIPVTVCIGLPYENQEVRKITYEEARKFLGHASFGPHFKSESVSWVLSPQGRARQLNAATSLSGADFFWFLHGDSLPESSALEKVIAFAGRMPQSLGYGFLSFDKDGPLLCRLNALGANLRSLAFQMPFEDQGLFISKSNFKKLGGFSEDIPYGEGHDLVWRAKELGLRVESIGYEISTSARRYRDEGWLRTTTRFFYLTWKQALPFMMKKMQSKKRSCTAIAVFVKTPGLSHLKTRLSRSIGVAEAEDFQQLALAQLTKTLGSLKDVSIYWAISEADALHFHRWKNFSRIWQSDGDLGNKIDHVYRSLITRYSRVLIIGSDAPQIRREHLSQAESILDRQDFVLGPARDGGFWLFGGRIPVDANIWKNTPWSSPTTFPCLFESLPQTPGLLDSLSDVDTLQDIPLMLQEMEGEQAKSFLESLSSATKRLLLALDEPDGR